MVLSEFFITRVHWTKDFFLRQQVSCCPLVWMRHGKTLNNRVFRLRESFFITCNERYSSFRCFLDRDGSVSIQTRNLRILATEIFKDSKGIARNVFGNALISMSLKIPVRIISLVFSWTQVRSVFNGIEKIALLGSKIMDLKLLEMKGSKYVNGFRNTMTCKYYATCIDLIWYIIWIGPKLVTTISCFMTSFVHFKGWSLPCLRFMRPSNKLDILTL